MNSDCGGDKLSTNGEVADESYNVVNDKPEMKQKSSSLVESQINSNENPTHYILLQQPSQKIDERSQSEHVESSGVQIGGLDTTVGKTVSETQDLPKSDTDFVESVNAEIAHKIEAENVQADKDTKLVYLNYLTIFF